MKYDKQRGAPFCKGDMTPMIDMTFQLIAFFMVLINFTEADQNQRINLPSSELAKPPDGPLELPITLQLTDEQTVIFGGDETPIGGLSRLLLREASLIKANPKRTIAEATVIIRADKAARTGEVQEIIKYCQEAKFEKFALRAKQQQRKSS